MSGRLLVCTPAQNCAGVEGNTHALSGVLIASAGAPAISIEIDEERRLALKKSGGSAVGINTQEHGSWPPSRYATSAT